MRRARRNSAVASLTVALAALILSCAPTLVQAEPDRSPVDSHIAVSPGPVASAEPDHIELRSASGAAYLSSAMHAEKLMRGGESGQQLNPVDELPVWWGESAMPGTSAAGTVVVVGHNYTARPAPFRALRAVQPGDRVVLGTPNGVLEYAVDSAEPLPKGSLLGAHPLRESIPGRLVLANCDVREGEATDDNFIVTAHLLEP